MHRNITTSAMRIRAHDVGLGVLGDQLTVDGCVVSDLAVLYGTPLWIFSAKTLRHNLASITSAFRKAQPKSRVVYASKANPAPGILAIMAQEGAMVDIASLGHARLAERAKIPTDQIVVNGNCKSTDYLRWAISSSVAMINVDSLDELHEIVRLRRVGNPELKIALRLATEAARHYDDPTFLTSEMETKFGLSEGEALEAAALIAGADGLRLVGLHHHLGFTAYDLEYSANLDLQRRRRVVEQLVSTTAKLRRQHGSTIEVFNLGGGFRIKTDGGYGPRGVRSLPGIEETVNATAVYARELLQKSDLPEVEIWIEPGGYIASSAAIFVARLRVLKKAALHQGTRDWAFLEDTSAYHFVRRLMADIYHPALVANRMSEACTGLLHIAGATCAPDAVTVPTLMPDLVRGDLIALLDHGAYCESIATEYCAFPLPATAIVDNGASGLLRPRRTVEDIVRAYAYPVVMKGPRGPGILTDGEP